MFGADADVLVMSPAEYQLACHMLEPAPLDLGDFVLSPMPGTLISFAVKVREFHFKRTFRKFDPAYGQIIPRDHNARLDCNIIFLSIIAGRGSCGDGPRTMRC
jgi:hypothetical protein